MKVIIINLHITAINFLTALLAISAAGLFALQADERENNGFQISRGPGFYIQVSE